MLRKKSKVVKKRIISQHVYKYLTAEEMHTKEQHYLSHINNLKNCLNYIKSAASEILQLSKKKLEVNKWQEYLNCCPWPKAYKPPDIRLFIEKLKYLENICREKNSISWLLTTNDRSLLTQDFSCKDLTRSTLKLGNKTNFGMEYEDRIDNCLKMLQRIEDFFESGLKLNNNTMEQLNDIKKLKTALQEQINEFFNHYTYRILCSEEAYMNSIDAITTEYNFQANNFQIHIWSLKNVPIRFSQLESSHLTANLNGIKATLAVPVFIMKENYTIRALHLNFDHISEKARVVFQKVVEPLAKAIISQTDLAESLAYEKQLQSEIQNRVRHQLVEQREEYEEKLKLLEQQQTKVKNKNEAVDGDKPTSKTKIIKPTLEPDLITDDMFPDIWEDFKDQDQQAYENYFNIMAKELIKLNADEINLRKYFILGGIYQLLQIEKPQHFDFNSFNMTWHLDNSKLLIHKDFIIPSHSKSLRRSTRVFKRETRRSHSFKLEEFTDTAEHKDPWFILSLQLPEYLCNWDQPIVCQYETVTNATLSPNVLKEEQKVHPEAVENKTLDSNSVANSVNMIILAAQKPELVNSATKLQEISKGSIPETYRSNVRLQKLAKENGSLQGLDDIVNVYDFPLDHVLTKPQIRQIEKHVLPQMISSFRFRKELEEYVLKANQVASKSKSKLMRRHFEKAAQPTADDKYFFKLESLQNSPDRLVPVYNPNETTRILHFQTHTSIADPNVNVHYPKTFAQLMKLINLIKLHHKNKPQQLLELKPFKSRFPIINKRFKLLEKPKLKTVFSKSSLQRVPSTKSRNKLQPNKSVSKVTLVESQQSALNEAFPIKNIVEENTSMEEYSYWSTKHILKTEYNREQRTFVIQTDRLGYFGFAFKQYEHFPFKFWKLQPNENDPLNEIIFTLDTQHVACTFRIDENGFKVRVTEPIKQFTKKAKIYLVTEHPISDLRHLKQIFKEKHLNIFPEKDASLYIENGYFSEKHLATELHTYNCMAVNCNQISFIYSDWNRLAHRRDIILKFIQYQDAEKNIVQVRITPEQAFFVDVSEICSDNLDIIKLDYNLSWRNINFYSDLHHLINSMYPAVNDLRCENCKLLIFLQTLLCAIRPLSFS